jgi:uncharacterized repeat protein (TIGR01451 family)
MAAVGSNGQAQITISLASGSYSITATYSGSANFQSSTSAPLAESVTTSTPSTVGADLAIDGFEADREVQPGDSLDYELDVVNLGRGTANSVKLTDVLPAGTTFLRASTSAGACTGPAAGQTGTVVCSVGSLSRYAEWSVRIRVRVVARPGSIISNTVGVSSSTPDPNLANNSATRITKVVADD